MANWQRAEEIPGLLSGGPAPPLIPGSAGSLMSTGAHGGGPLSIDLPLWQLLGRNLLYVIGVALIIPAPWIATNYYRWMISRLRVPERPEIAFTGQVGDIWYVFVAMGLLSYVGLVDDSYLQYLLYPVEAFLLWMIVRWIAANFSSQGRQLPITFNGSALAFIGWDLLMILSFITVIGWAWVVIAWMQWICRNVNGTRREIVFNASGLELLWRTLVFVLACVFIIPIPWMQRWYTAWYVSQFALVDRAA